MIFSPFSLYIVVGDSMYPTLKSKQKVITFNWTNFLKLKKGDVVVGVVNGRRIIKRIKKISKDEIFVVGDNKEESTDSRSYGPIKKADILGKVIYSV